MKNKENGTGIGILGLLGLIFITLKLCHVIDWSWWFVLAPFWIGIVAWLIIVNIIFILIYIFTKK